MAVEERVVIHVDLDVDPVKNRAKVEAMLRGLEGRFNRFNREVIKTERFLGRVVRAFSKMFGVLSKISFIGLALEIGLVSTALAGVRLAMITGRLVVSAYKATLTGLGIAAGGVAAALGTVAAAARQFNEAMLAPYIGGARQARQAVRGALSDDLISYFGIEGLQGAITELAKSGVEVGKGYSGIIRSLGDFASDAEGLAALVKVFATIQKEGKITETVLGQLVEINPIFQKAFAEALGITGKDAPKLVQSAAAAGRITADTFTKVLSGELEATDPFEGQLERMNETLFGRIKGFLPRMIELWSRIGQPFIERFTEAFTVLENTMHRAVLRMTGPVSRFSTDSLIPGLESGFERLNNWIVRLIHDTLPRMDEVGETFRKVFRDMRDFFTDIGRVFQALEEGGRIAIATFGPAFKAIFGGGPTGLGGLIKQMANRFEENEEQAMAFGDSLGRLVEGIMMIFKLGNDAFFDNIESFTGFIDVLSQDVVPAIREVIGLFKDALVNVLPPLSTALKIVADSLHSVASALRTITGLNFGGPGGIGNIGGLASMALLAGPMILGRRGGGMANAAGQQMGFFSRMAARATGRGSGGLGLMLPLQYGALWTKDTFNAARAAGAGRIGAAGAVARGGVQSLAARGGLMSGAGGGLMSGIAGFGIGSTVGRSHGAGWGVLAGAGAGAAAGFALGGPAGALIGGALGLVGGFMGGNSYEKMKVLAVERAEEIAEDFNNGLQLSLSKGGGRQAMLEVENAMIEMLANVEERAKEMGVNAEVFEEELLKKQEQLQRQISLRTKILDRNLESLSSVTDVTAEAIEDLADKVGYDLSNAFINLSEAAVELGLLSEFNVSPTGVRDESFDILLKGLQGSEYMTGLVAEEKKADIQAVVDEMAALIDSGTDFDKLPPSMVTGLFESILAFAQAEYPQLSGSDLISPLMATLHNIEANYPQLAFATEMFGQPGVGDVTSFEASTRAALMDENREIIQAVELGIIDQARFDATAEATQRMKDFDIELQRVRGAQRSGLITWDEFMDSSERISTAAASYSQNMDQIIDDLTQANIGEMMADFNSELEESALWDIDDVILGWNDKVNSEASLMARSASVIRAGLEAVGHEMQWWSPVNPNSVPIIAPNNVLIIGGMPGDSDTATPRGDTASSRFSRTMGFHDSLTRRFGGKRTITSGLRNFALGSVNSDHIMGRAYDMVGDNLVGYQQAVLGAGGFAEFHGDSSSRHLHVVPPAGDTSAPVSAAGNTYNFSITGGPNASPEDIARAVEAKIRKAERDRMERM